MRLGRTCVLEVSAAALEEVVPAGSGGGPGEERGPLGSGA